jgi:hypothetical protein
MPLCVGHSLVRLLGYRQKLVRYWVRLGYAARHAIIEGSTKYEDAAGRWSAACLLDVAYIPPTMLPGASTLCIDSLRIPVFLWGRLLRLGWLPRSAFSPVLPSAFDYRSRALS